MYIQRLRQIILGAVLGIIIFNLNITPIVAKEYQESSRSYKVLVDHNIETNKGFDVKAVIIDDYTLVPAKKMYEARWPVAMLH